MDKQVKVILKNGVELNVGMPRFDRGEMQRLKEMCNGIEIDGLVFPDGRIWRKLR